MVYIDHNVFNYSEVNNRIIEVEAFGSVGESSCVWITLYMICLAIYPHCNVIQQTLVPPCMDNCLEYSAMCRMNLRTAALQLDNEHFILNCFVPFQAYDSVSVDTGNCYNFSCKLICTYLYRVNNK